jgi:hypothetical protein
MTCRYEQLLSKILEEAEDVEYELLRGDPRRSNAAWRWCLSGGVSSAVVLCAWNGVAEVQLSNVFKLSRVNRVLQEFILRDETRISGAITANRYSMVTTCFLQLIYNYNLLLLLYFLNSFLFTKIYILSISEFTQTKTTR